MNKLIVIDEIPIVIQNDMDIWLEVEKKNNYTLFTYKITINGILI